MSNFTFAPYDFRDYYKPENGDIICPECHGEKQQIICKKCLGKGYLDWIENIMGPRIRLRNPYNLITFSLVKNPVNKNATIRNVS